MTSPTLRRAAALAGSLALLALLPAAASAAGNPQVVRVDPTTGVVKQLAGGAPFTHLGGLAFGPTGMLYVANQGPVGPSPRGAGIYALRPPTYAAASIASGTAPAAVVASGGTLYSLDGDRVVGIDGITGAERTVTAGGLYDAYGVDPAFGAVSGNTLYTTASSSCDSAEGGGAYVIAVDTTTGAQTLVKAFGCHALGGIATTPGGMLTVAVGGRPAKIVQLDPQSGAVTTLSSGGSLKTPQGLALDAAGDVLVADSTSGVIAVSGQGGQQSPYTSPGALGGATGIAVGPDGALYVSEAGVPPKLAATAAGRQQLSASGLALTVRCNQACTVGYSATVSGFTVSGFTKSAAFRGVQGRRSVRITLPRQVRREIAAALRHGKKVTAKVALTPQDPRSGSLGKRTTLPIRIL
jgi:sugar lactone lactonase YvrE